jgi:hypothetical protein
MAGTNGQIFKVHFREWENYLNTLMNGAPGAHNFATTALPTIQLI